MTEYILSIATRDRPGIVAELSGALFDLSGNILAAAQTVLQGYFTMMILCTVKGAASPEDLRRKVVERVPTDLNVYVTERQPAPITAPKTETFIITLVGPDKPGILYSLTRYVASRCINIDDLYCRATEGEFVVICQVSVPSEIDFVMLQADLEESGRKNGFSAHLQHENVFVATNEIRFGRAT